MTAPDDDPRPTEAEREVDRDDDRDKTWFEVAQELCHDPFKALTDGR